MLCLFQWTTANPSRVTKISSPSKILKKNCNNSTHMKKSNGGVLSLSFLRFFSSKSVAPIKWLPFVSREFHSRF